MKKFLALCLALVLALSLAACATENPPANSAAGSQASEPAQAATQQPVNIIFANSNNENTETGQQLQAMLDYITEQTGGAVTFTPYFGGQLCAANEEYDYLRDGSLQMAAPKPADFASTNPYIYGLSCNTNWEDCWDYWQHIFVENEETAAIANKYVAEDGLVMVGALMSGQGCVLGVKDFNAFPDDLVGQKMGAVQSADVWLSLGINVVNTFPPEIYESLSRGVYDYVGFALSYYLPMSLNEVAPYVMNANEFQTSLTVMVNDDTWAQLTPETQQIFRDAVKVAYDMGVGQADELNKRVEGAAEHYWTLDAEHASYMTGFMEKVNGSMLIGYAKTLDGDQGVQDMVTLQQAKAAYTGMDVVPDEYK